MQQIVFSIQGYNYLKDELLFVYPNLEDGSVETKQFPDGEFYHRIISRIEHKHIVLIGGTINDNATLELFDIAYACIQLGAAKLTLVIPYLGYATMERAVKQGEVVKAKSRALLLSSLPETPYGNELLLFDLHTEGLPYYFEKNIRTVHIYCKDIIKEIAIELGASNFVLASTDAGRAKWVESLANDMQVNAAFVFKRRISGNETQITSISAEVKNKTVIIYDDMIRTGGSLLQAAHAYKEAGAAKIYVIATHGLFINNALEKLADSNLIEKVVVTNTHPNANYFASDFLAIKSIAPLISAHI